MTKQDFYRRQAEYIGGLIVLSAIRLNESAEYTYEQARIAGHFGLLALALEPWTEQERENYRNSRILRHEGN